MESSLPKKLRTLPHAQIIMENKLKDFLVNMEEEPI